VWKNQFEIVADYNIIAIDLPSHDKSDKFQDLSLELYVNVLKELIESLELDKVILCGHSLGGAIIQDFYFRYPDKVFSLILIGTGGRLRVSPEILNSLKYDYQEFLNGMPVRVFYRKTPSEIIEFYVKEASKVAPEVTFADFSICDTFDTLDKTSTIKVPCLVLVGDDDKLTPVKYSRFFHEKLPRSELVIIKNAGHMVMVEKPEDVNKAIINFVNNST